MSVLPVNIVCVGYDKTSETWDYTVILCLLFGNIFLQQCTYLFGLLPPPPPTVFAMYNMSWMWHLELIDSLHRDFFRFPWWSCLVNKMIHKAKNTICLYAWKEFVSWNAMIAPLPSPCWTGVRVCRGMHAGMMWWGIHGEQADALKVIKGESGGREQGQWWMQDPDTNFNDIHWIHLQISFLF